jgi:hypothetical protein
MKTYNSMEKKIDKMYPVCLREISIIYQTSIVNITPDTRYCSIATDFWKTPKYVRPT